MAESRWRSARLAQGMAQGQGALTAVSGFVRGCYTAHRWENSYFYLYKYFYIEQGWAVT